MTPITLDPPPVSALAVTNPGETSFMRYFAAARPDGAPRIAAAWTPLDALAPVLVSALVKSEDPRFFEHRGVDWLTTARVAVMSLRQRHAMGGASTITQQLARNLYLVPSRSIRRKLREAVLALRIERAVSKARVLELYLNLVDWGGGAWGCAAASRHYFGKTPRDLDLFESTFLVTLLPAPNAGLSGRHAYRSRRKQFLVLYLMLLSGLADPEACAVCSERMRELHRLTAEGVPLIDALAASAQVTGSTDTAFLREMVMTLGVAPLAATTILASHCGYAQQGMAFRRLRERFGVDVLKQVIVTSSYAPMRQHAAAAGGAGK